MDKTKVLYLNSTFTTKAADDGADEAIYVEGYANTVDIDRSGDVILTSAWSAGIENYLKNPIFLAYHDHDNPIGRLDEYKIDAKGLWVRAKISPAAGDVYKLIKDGVLTAFSVGFMIKDAAYDPINDIFFIKEVELMEISVVSVPCNQESLFSLAKSFASEAEFNSFKSQYVSKATLDNGQEAKDLSNNKIKGILSMTPEEIQAMLNKGIADGLAKAEAAREKAATEKSAADAAAAAIDAKINAAVEARVTVGQSGAEKLLADIEAKFEAQTTATKNVLDGLEASIKEKSAELEAIQKSKMKFNDVKDTSAVTAKEKETAVFLKTIMNRPNVSDTKYGTAMLEKAGAHVPGAVPWEQEVSFNMENEIRQKLIVQSLLKQIAMQTNVMKIPLNPATGLGTWVTNAQFGTTASTGAAQTHQLSEITLSAYKVATLEYLAYEEEEDSLIILLPIIRDAMIRRVSRSVDQAFLRGAGSGADPVKGLGTYATTGLTTDVSVGTKVTVANLRNMRKNLGIFGLDPSEVTYVVSQDVYYDLLEDPVFQTMNQVGNAATLLTGQIGQIGNSPVVVSGEFATKAAGATGVNIGALCVNTSNFIAGNQRGLRFDTQMMAETQRMVLVSSLRTGLTQLTANQGMGVTKLTWIA